MEGAAAMADGLPFVVSDAQRKNQLSVRPPTFSVESSSGLVLNDWNGVRRCGGESFRSFNPLWLGKTNAGRSSCLS